MQPTLTIGHHARLRLAKGALRICHVHGYVGRRVLFRPLNTLNLYYLKPGDQVEKVWDPNAQ